MVFSKANILEIRKTKTVINILPVFNIFIGIVAIIVLVFYMAQVNFIYGSSSTIDSYKKEIRMYREQNVDLQTFSNLVYDLDPQDIKRQLGMVEGRRMDAVHIDFGEVAVLQ